MSYLKDIIESILPSIVPKASKDVREFVNDFLDKLEKRAKKTTNPFDDLLVIILKKAFYNKDK